MKHLLRDVDVRGFVFYNQARAHALAVVEHGVASADVAVDVYAYLVCQ